jgi:hypothetical protein
MRQILDGSEPILLVTHDADDHGWQFIGSSDAAVEDGRIVCLAEIVKLDPSVLQVADLPPGWQAVREGRGRPWCRRLHSSAAMSREIEAAQLQHIVLISSVERQRIRYGEEAEDWGADRQPCHDCGVVKGQYHVFGCDVERCPVCGSQLLHCECDD